MAKSKKKTAKKKTAGKRGRKKAVANTDKMSAAEKRMYAQTKKLGGVK
jgi:hypothetical protein